MTPGGLSPIAKIYPQHASDSVNSNLSK
ncbi:hypothetical protein EMIT0111MI5_20314 [Burkholderia sp. IT-111MI5]